MKMKKTNMSNLGILPIDLWRFIGLKLDSVADRVRFGAVCKSWKSLLPSRQPPWLMLPESKDITIHEDFRLDFEPLLVGFASVGDEQVYKLNLPELCQARCVGSTGKWLIKMQRDKSVSILNPFSRHQIHLPPFYFNEEEEFDLNHIIQVDYDHDLSCKIVLSSSPCGRECVAMAIHHFRILFAFARPGDASWTPVKTPAPITAQDWASSFQDVIFHKQKFYAIDSNARLLVCDIGDSLNPPQFSFLTHWVLKPSAPVTKHYLVQVLDELLVVVRFFDNLSGRPRYTTNGFEVYKFDFVNSKFNELKTLGGHSLFLGSNTSVSVLASDYFGFVKGNCIYFSDEFPSGWSGHYGYQIYGGHDMGVFDLGDKSITPRSTSSYPRTMWIVPI